MRVEEILNKSYTCQDEKVDKDRLYELLDIFENASGYDYLMSDEYIRDMCRNNNIRKNNKDYNTFVDFYKNERVKVFYSRLSENLDIKELVENNWCDIVSYTAVALSWVLSDTTSGKNRVSIIMHLLELSHECGEYAFVYELLKYMYDNFKVDCDVNLP